ncbi:MAG: HAD-IG family 5'-nucleotidase [Acidimicrobiia bacterium]|nr:HAD-IG family 5'-nucleotidase [Acidimicrobiia bacterium]
MNDYTIPQPSPARGIHVNRTLNLRSIQAIGYDMDYTLVHYHVDQWEQRAFDHAKDRLASEGWPVGDLQFDSQAVIRGLAIDLELGNLLKATRFGYVIRATHGTRFLDYDEVRSAYSGTLVDLSEDRFVFMNSLFSLSEASLYGQLIDLLEAGKLRGGVGFADCYELVRDVINDSHQEGQLKAEILEDPERFIDLDSDIVLALRDQRNSGKRLMLITNSDWDYAQQIMTYAFDRFLPEGHTWRELFDTVIVSAAKPAFFTSDLPLYKVEDEAKSLLRPHFGPIEPGGVFFGGNARLVEHSLGLSGDEILYVGDHLFGDVHFSKALLRWRTALILRELESEVAALIEFLPGQVQLDRLMHQKQQLEAELAALRLSDQRAQLQYAEAWVEVDDLKTRIDATRTRIAALDNEIGPLARTSGGLRNEAWGPIMRSGQDKSLFARQVEKYADVYTSRVSNLLYPSPFAMLRAVRLDLPHDPHPERGTVPLWT